jgi:hypothetical protein
LIVTIKDVLVGESELQSAPGLLSVLIFRVNSSLKLELVGRETFINDLLLPELKAALIWLASPETLK